MDSEEEHEGKRMEVTSNLQFFFQDKRHLCKSELRLVSISLKKDKVTPVLQSSLWNLQGTVSGGNSVRQTEFGLSSPSSHAAPGEASTFVDILLPIYRPRRDECFG